MDDVQEQAERLFATLLGLDPSERAAYIDEACRDLPSVRIRVEQLLREDEAAGSFLNKPLLGSHPIPNLLELRLQNPADDAQKPSHSYVPQFQPNDVIEDRFVVRRFIARGGMGEVYEVEDRHLHGVHVALKTILSQYALDPVMRERFKREVLMAREVVHPHVCPIYDLVEWQRPEGVLMFLTMKLLEGETLAARLSRVGALPLEEVTAIAHQVASGLAAAHNAGILHRDIKPANILLTMREDRLHAFVTDFGLARPFVAETTALTAGVAGTPGFMAPELYQGAAPSRASDVYAMGVVIYEMLTGRLPGAVMPETARKKGEARSGAIPPGWKSALERALQSDPAARFHDIPEFARSLPQLIAGGESVAVQPWKLSRRKLIALGATGLAAASGGVWLGWNEVLDVFVPLPPRIQVALMAWPVNSSSDLISGILDLIGQRLIRAEAQNKKRHLAVFSRADIQNSQIPIVAPDGAIALGATVVLAASLQSAGNASHLLLELFSVETKAILRKAVLSFVAKDVAAIADKASRLAVNMLGLSFYEPQVHDSEELTGVPTAVFQAFSQAQESAAEPNNTGLEKAIIGFQKVLDMDPHFAPAYAELAIVYVLRYLADQDPANLAAAGGNSRLALEYNPNSARAILSVALVKLYSGDELESTKYFDRALAIDPDNPQTLFYSAQAYGFMNQNDKVEAVYRTIIQKRPNYWPAYNDLGYLLSHEGNHRAAAEAFSTAKAVAPLAARPQANLGAEYVILGRLSEAREECNESIHKSPTDIAHRTLGDLDFEATHYDKARDHYQQAAILNPRFHDNWRDLADAEAKLHNQAAAKENYAKAARVLSEAVPERTRGAYQWATLAFYFAKTEDRGQAESALQRVGPIDSRNPATQLMAIQAITLLGRKEEALQLLLGALDKGLTPIQVDFSLDLAELQKDPRYVSRVAKLKSKGANPAS